MEKARRLLTERLPDLDPASGGRGLPDDVAIAAFQVGQYLHNLGVLVARWLLSPELAAGFLGDSVLRLWRVLSPLIVRERELRMPPHYQHYFEHLAATARQVDPTRARSKLRTFAGTTPAIEHADRPRTARRCAELSSRAAFPNAPPQPPSRRRVCRLASAVPSNCTVGHSSSLPA